MSFINTFQYNKPIQSFIKKIGSNCSTISYNPTSNIIYSVAGASGDDPITAYNGGTLQPIATFLTSSNRTRGSLFNKYNNKLYINSTPSATGITTTLIYDCTTLQQVSTIASVWPNTRYRGTVTPDYTFIPYGTPGTTYQSAGGFYKINNITNEVTNVSHGGGWGQTCAWDSRRNRLWIPCQASTYNYILVYDLNTNTTAFRTTNEGRINPPFYGFPSTINGYDPINDVMYIMEEYSGKVYKLNAETGAIISNITMASAAAVFAFFEFNDDYSELYTTCTTKFHVWDTATMTEKYSVPIGALGGVTTVLKRKDGSLVFANGSGLFEPIIN